LVRIRKGDKIDEEARYEKTITSIKNKKLRNMMKVLNEKCAGWVIALKGMKVIYFHPLKGEV